MAQQSVSLARRDLLGVAVHLAKASVLLVIRIGHSKLTLRCVKSESSTTMLAHVDGIAAPMQPPSVEFLLAQIRQSCRRLTRRVSNLIVRNQTATTPEGMV